MQALSPKIPIYTRSIALITSNPLSPAGGTLLLRVEEYEYLCVLLNKSI